MVDLSIIPLTALSVKTKQIISNLLNPAKHIPCDNGFPRDWRGLAHLSNLEGEMMPMLSSHSDPTMFILQAIEKKEKKYLTDLQDMLSTLDRWDIIDDTQELMEEDATNYLDHLQNSQMTAEPIEESADAKVLTVDDLYRTRQGLENQRYDAFVLYANEDMEFASEMIDKLEKFDIKLCVKDRDLIGGITFEHEAVMTLISERCNRLIVVISPDFIKSSANKFFLSYAQAVSIDKRQRKIIPCLYKRCVLPPQLSYMFILDYTRVGLYNFWGRLRDSIQVANNLQNTNLTMQRLRNKDATPIENNPQYCVTYPDTETLPPTKCNSVQDLQNSDCIAQTTLTKSVENVMDSEKEKHKSSGLLKWTKKKLKFKENTNKKRNFETITETLTIDNLPSLNNLNTLSVTIDATDVAPKKPKEKKSKKRKTLKQILLKS